MGAKKLEEVHSSNPVAKIHYKWEKITCALGQLKLSLGKPLL